MNLIWSQINFHLNKDAQERLLADKVPAPLIHKSGWTIYIPNEEEIESFIKFSNKIKNNWCIDKKNCIQLKSLKKVNNTPFVGQWDLPLLRQDKQTKSSTNK